MAGPTRPADPPAQCPVCDAPYDSVSVHAGGLMVNLLDNPRYRRVCFAPAERDGAPAVAFYHHSHEQTGDGAGDDTGDGASEDAGGDDDSPPVER